MTNKASSKEKKVIIQFFMKKSENYWLKRNFDPHNIHKVRFLFIYLLVNIYMEDVNTSFYLKTCYAVLLHDTLSEIKIIEKHIKNPFVIRQKFGDFHTGF